MRKIPPDYTELKRNIATYIDKYPTATNKSNRKKLIELNELKSRINTDTKAKQKYYALRDELTISNGGFAMTHAMKYSNVLNDNTPITELFQEATIGLIETIDTYDPNMGTAFTTYAWYHVRKRLIDYIKKNKLVKAPRNIARNIKHVSEIQEYLMSRLGRNPTTIEIQEGLKEHKKLDVKLDIIDKVLILLELNSAGYEDSFVSEYVDQLSSDDHESTLFRALELNILSSIQRYTEKQQRIIKLRFGIAEEYPHTVEEIKLMLELNEEDIDKIGP